METRRTNKKNVTTTYNRVDNGSLRSIASGLQPVRTGQDARDKTLGTSIGGGGTKIHPDAWYEIVLVAQYLYREDEEAEIADVFEWLRLKTMDGTPISPGLLKRVNREIATELGPWE